MKNRLTIFALVISAIALCSAIWSIRYHYATSNMISSPPATYEVIETIPSQENAN